MHCKHEAVTDLVQLGRGGSEARLTASEALTGCLMGKNVDAVRGGVSDAVV